MAFKDHSHALLQYLQKLLVFFFFSDLFWWKYYCLLPCLCTDCTDAAKIHFHVFLPLCIFRSGFIFFIISDWEIFFSSAVNPCQWWELTHWRMIFRVMPVDVFLLSYIQVQCFMYNATSLTEVSFENNQSVMGATKVVFHL